MKCTSLVLFSVLLAPPLFADAGEHIIPAGSLISCTTAEPRLSSKTTAVGDPVLCHLAHSERYGRATLPYNSYLVGRFEAYKDPGHFVGKGYMELKFEQLVIEPETEVPIDARVVDVTGYKVDTQGRILGKGHAVRDAVMWSIPVLWPIDLLMLPMRGPRPTLKEETRMTLKVMDDFAVPNATCPTRIRTGSGIATSRTMSRLSSSSNSSSSRISSRSTRRSRNINHSRSISRNIATGAVPAGSHLQHLPAAAGGDSAAAAAGGGDATAADVCLRISSSSAARVHLWIWVRTAGVGRAGIRI